MISDNKPSLVLAVLALCLVGGGVAAGSLVQVDEPLLGNAARRLLQGSAVPVTPPAPTGVRPCEQLQKEYDAFTDEIKELVDVVKNYQFLTIGNPPRCADFKYTPPCDLSSGRCPRIASCINPSPPSIQGSTASSPGSGGGPKPCDVLQSEHDSYIARIKKLLATIKNYEPLPVGDPGRCPDFQLIPECQLLCPSCSK